MLVPIQMGTNISDENQHKSVNLSLEELKYIKIIIFLIHYLFR